VKYVDPLVTRKLRKEREYIGGGGGLIGDEPSGSGGRGGQRKTLTFLLIGIRAARGGARGYQKWAEEGDDGRKKMNTTNVVNACALRMKQVLCDCGHGAKLYVVYNIKLEIGFTLID
jgi:hypothetical protein